MRVARHSNTARYRAADSRPATDIVATHPATVLRALDPEERIAVPIRFSGAATSSTDCNVSPTGTTVCLSGLDRIVNIDAHNGLVTAQGGVRLVALAEALSQHGLELIGNYEMMGRTLGGAIASPGLGPGIGDEAAALGSHVVSLKLITGAGKAVVVRDNQKNLMAAVRSSYGVLGAIAEATLRVRPIRTFSATHRCLAIGEFAGVVDRLSTAAAGFRFCLMPYRDRVYLDLRRYASRTGSAYRGAWRLKDWGEGSVVPQVCRSLNRILPIHSVRYRLIDSITETTHGIVNSRLLHSGNNSTTGSGLRTASSTRPVLYSSWCFPASDFSYVLSAYQAFARETYERTGYRCDLPVIGYRIAQDRSALLSPAYDEPMIVLQTASTQPVGWDDFVIDLADFAEHWGGVAIYSQSRSLRADYAERYYAQRLEMFRQVRRQLDPHDRLLTPFMAQFFR